MYNPGVIAVSMQSFDVSTDSGDTISGICAELTTAQATGKALFLTDLKKGGKTLSPVPVTIYDGASTGAKTAVSAVAVFVVDTDDSVTIPS